MGLRKRTRISFFLVVVSILVIASFALYLLFPRLQTQFHYERERPTHVTGFYILAIHGFDNTPTNISISFVDDPSLLYSIDVTQHQPGLHHDVYSDDYPSYRVIGVGGGDDEQASFIDIVLGTGVYYNITIGGSSIEYVSITFDNGALVSGQYIALGAPSVDSDNATLYLTFTENVNFTDLGLELRNLRFNLVLDIDLPEGMNGRLISWLDIDFTYTAIIGWNAIYDTYLEFQTSSIEEPLLFMYHMCPRYIHCRLLD